MWGGCLVAGPTKSQYSFEAPDLRDASGNGAGIVVLMALMVIGWAGGCSIIGS